MEGDEGYQAVPDRSASRRFLSPLFWVCLLLFVAVGTLLRAVGAAWWTLIPLAALYAVSMGLVTRHIDGKTD